MGLRDWLRKWLLGDDAEYKRIESIALRRDYAQGRQRPQLKVKPGGTDDNITLNFLGVIRDRAVSDLFGAGVKFTFEDEAQQTYIDGVWNTNRREMLLTALAQHGAETGMCYLKMIPDGMVARDGSIYPRLVALDPTWVKVETDPQDIANVTGYVIQYAYYDAKGNEVAHRQTIRKGEAGWDVVDEETNTGGRWYEVGREVWPYWFAPVVHWQNLPAVDSVYGEPDISDTAIGIQDKLNYHASNIAKIIRLQAHQRLWISNAGEMKEADWEPGRLIKIGEGSQVGAIDANGDLPGASSFLHLLRQSLFDVTRTVDLDSMADKLGSLTNFGLRVLFHDNLAKTDIKRSLYGDGLEEANYRLLLMAGMAVTDGGEVVWGDNTPTSDSERVTTDLALVGAGAMSVQTLAERAGVDWDTEKVRIEEQKAAEDTLGGALLRAFNKGE